MKNKTTPQELREELVESSAVAGAVKREADGFNRGYFIIQFPLSVYFQILKLSILLIQPFPNSLKILSVFT